MYNGQRGIHRNRLPWTIQLFCEKWRKICFQNLDDFDCLKFILINYRVSESFTGNSLVSKVGIAYVITQGSC
ncbi:hypothetical protein T4A_12639 [Trichinella pseudospiralis]|uniref:Uncharacterized protein n=1 Tax=Trichinella pseudospiralis TaxID=6337 RepID=A0A0V1E1P6_TRIPS|nr:hypothetical protein T4A_12639 [Trichinella pseudospiralis]